MDYKEFVVDDLKRSTNELDEDSTIEDVKEYLNEYDGSEVEGVLNNIKGSVHERAFVYNENHDGDEIFAERFEKTNHPGSDIKLTNVETEGVSEIQLKATDSSDYVIKHMENHPDIPVMATEEVANDMGIESTGFENSEITMETQKVLEELGMDGFDKDVLEYTDYEIENGAISGLEDYNELMDNTIGDMLLDLGDAFATGGYLAIYEMLKNKPEKQKKLVKAGITAGILDGVIDFDSFSLEDGFDLNPLFIASIGSWFVMRAKNSSNAHAKIISRSFCDISSKAFKTIKYASYAAIGTEILDIATGIEFVDMAGDAVDSLDFLDVVGDGADLIDGLASFGTGILVSKGVKHIFDEINSEDRVKIKKLSKKVENKRYLKKLLKNKVPVPFLIGPYNEIK
ncbi:MAG: hypothetical protein FH751_07315 [Firmicutes bacterium]|nr:hypothetical protein [Bacillota bacterium]